MDGKINVKSIRGTVTHADSIQGTLDPSKPVSGKANLFGVTAKNIKSALGFFLNSSNTIFS
jgi:hypothetical protein